MGLFDKLKNILFEEDEMDNTMTDIPVYNKKDNKEEKVDNTPVKEVVKPVAREEVSQEKIENTRFRNVKRDIDLSFADEEVSPSVSEVQHTRDIMAELKKDVQAQREERQRIEQVHIPETEDKPLPQRKTVFQSFDAEEFDRINSRTTSRQTENTKRYENVSKRREEPKTSMSNARLANNNFSATSTGRKDVNPDRYKLDDDKTKGKKPFRPSPVISPVYGILDKNYTADEIVDKTDGMKREKINPIVRTPEIDSNKKNNNIEVKTIDDAYEDYDVKEKEISIDSVREKAFGIHEEIEVPKKKTEIIDEVKMPTFEDKPIVTDVPEVIEENEEEILPVEDLVEDNDDIRSRFVKDEEYEEDSSATLLDDEPEVEDYDDTSSADEYQGESLLDDDTLDKVNKKGHIMNDLEKTSTLQILDDIEKELNSIKSVPSSNDDIDDSLYTDEEKLERNDTLENDLFNLIDSMYDDGEEDEDND